MPGTGCPFGLRRRGPGPPPPRSAGRRGGSAPASPRPDPAGPSGRPGPGPVARGRPPRPRARCGRRSARRRAGLPPRPRPLTRTPSRTWICSRSSVRRALALSRSEYAGSTRGIPSMRTMRASWVLMCRKSRGSTRCAISLSEPASSTPVGPPPMMTKVSQACRRAGSVSRSASSKAKSTPAPDLQRILQRLQPGGVALPVGVSEVGVVGAGGEDEVVVADRAAVLEAHLAGLARSMEATRARTTSVFRRADGARCGWARRCRSGRARQLPPGRGAAGRGGGSSGRRLSPGRHSSVPRSLAASRPAKPAPTTTTEGRRSGSIGPPGCANHPAGSQRRAPGFMLLQRLSSAARYAGMAGWSVFWISLALLLGWVKRDPALPAAVRPPALGAGDDPAWPARRCRSIRCRCTTGSDRRST